MNVDESYGDYQGRVKCFACGAILEIKTEGGMLQSVDFAKAALASPVEEVVAHTS